LPWYGEAKREAVNCSACSVESGNTMSSLLGRAFSSAGIYLFLNGRKFSSYRQGLKK
jgi:hypothetical protein